MPAPRPIATLVTIMSIGKLNPYAASSASPTRPMNQVSMRLCAHHRRDAEEHGHGHVDEVPTDRTLG